jgi:NADH pyrophosphatase NudC (nudix superfamily)
MTKQINGLKNDFKLCPMCGSKNIENHGNRKWVCPDCAFDLYNNVASAVGVVIRDRYNNVLFEIRAKQPRKGYLALPGGFVDFEESAEEAVVRECREEIGVAVEGVEATGGIIGALRRRRPKKKRMKMIIMTGEQLINLGINLP